MDRAADAAGLAVLDLDAGCDVRVAAYALEAYFDDDREAEAVVVMVGGAVVGVSSRSRLRAIGSEPARAVGEGAGATLPGRSLRYRILRFACRTCAAQARRIHVDNRTAPVCPDGHGPMEPVR